MGLILGYYLQPVLLYGPAVLIAFSALTSGKIKWQWVGFALLPWLLGRLSLTLLAVFSQDGLRYSWIGGGGRLIYILSWVSAWLIYFAYLRKFSPASRTEQAQPYFLPQRVKWVVASAIALVAARYFAWLTRAQDPLWWWILFWAFEIALIVAVVRATPKVPLRFAGAALVIALAHWIAWFDNGIAEREFAKLCKEQAGIKLYKTVDLGPEYFTIDGKLSFILEGGDVDEAKFPSLYQFTRIPYGPVADSIWSNAHQTGLEVIERSTNSVVARFVMLHGERGGPPGINVDYRPIRTGDCPPKRVHTRDFLKKVFIQQN